MKKRRGSQLECCVIRLKHDVLLLCYPIVPLIDVVFDQNCHDTIWSFPTVLALFSHHKHSCITQDRLLIRLIILFASLLQCGLEANLADLDDARCLRGLMVPFHEHDDEEQDFEIVSTLSCKRWFRLLQRVKGGFRLLEEDQGRFSTFFRSSFDPTRSTKNKKRDRLNLLLSRRSCKDRWRERKGMDESRFMLNSCRHVRDDVRLRKKLNGPKN